MVGAAAQAEGDGMTWRREGKREHIGPGEHVSASACTAGAVPCCALGHPFLTLMGRLGCSKVGTPVTASTWAALRRPFCAVGEVTAWILNSSPGADAEPSVERGSRGLIGCEVGCCFEMFSLDVLSGRSSAAPSNLEPLVRCCCCVGPPLLLRPLLFWGESGWEEGSPSCLRVWLLVVTMQPALRVFLQGGAEAS